MAIYCHGCQSLYDDNKKLVASLEKIQEITDRETSNLDKVINDVYEETKRILKGRK